MLAENSHITDHQQNNCDDDCRYKNPSPRPNLAPVSLRGRSQVLLKKAPNRRLLARREGALRNDVEEHFRPIHQEEILRFRVARKSAPG